MTHFSLICQQLTVETVLKVKQPQQKEVPPTVAPVDNVTVTEGQVARFNTVVLGKPIPKVQWYREGALIPQSRDFEVCKVSFSVSKSSLLFICKFNFMKRINLVYSTLVRNIAYCT